MAELVQERYITPLAKWARILEIFVPGYMFGKAWGIAKPEMLDLYKAIFPAFLIDMAEKMKGLMVTNNEALQRLFATMAGALVGFGIVFALGFLMYIVLRDRKYLDAVRFTSITLIPLAVMNGTLSHVTNTIMESLGGGDTIESLTKAAVDSPSGQIKMFCLFYMLAIWMLAKRTGVIGWRRWGVIVVGVVFLGVYFYCGLGITANEAAVVLPKMMAAHGAH